MTTTKTVFDTSAFLAIINDEPGSEIAQKHISNACMCTINIAEVVTYLVRNGYTNDTDIHRIVNLIKPISFDEQVAVMAGKMISLTKKFGLSLGDRSCLATAKQLNLPVYTADRKWSELAKQVGVQVIQIRS
ncbi:MAG TPA: type II toxin-antitoxin system VapC family toxin [Aquella sp.]|nr:type II toxin-antitoxin system VapC family toxin [Aquella sp.]